MINPKPEHRLTFLEKQFVAMGGHLEGIQEDIAKLQAHVDLGFLQARDLLVQEIGELKQDIKDQGAKLDRIITFLETKGME
jgi:hypothetical protein